MVFKETDKDEHAGRGCAHGVLVTEPGNFFSFVPIE